MSIIAPAAPAELRAVPAVPEGAPVVPWHLYAVLFASASVVFGVLWDISWHQTIGRDTFWSPPHMAIYLGGVVAGVACATHVLRASFAPAAGDEETTVTFWRYFRGSLGAWMCIWGAIAMLTSAPFDDWWHNAYGLDVKILSPPHALLALGILMIQMGAMFMILALQNRRGDVPAFRRMFALAAGLVLINFTTVSSEYTWRIFQHGTLFWQVVAGIAPLALIAPAVAGRLRWPATATAATYTAMLLVLGWVLPLFAAEPKLAPIRNDLAQMMPPQFPLLLIVPAIAIDLVLRRWGGRPRGWGLAAILGTTFLATFAAVQWPFADLLNWAATRPTILMQHLIPYMIPADSFIGRGEYVNPATGTALITGMAIALGIAILSARAGLAWGGFMARVQR
jgi:hypothetical protein